MLFLQKNGWMEAGMAPGDKADKWKMQFQIYLIENVLGSLSWAIAQDSHIHMRRRKGEAVHAWQTICCHHYTPVSFLHILDLNQVWNTVWNNSAVSLSFLHLCACLWLLQMFFCVCVCGGDPISNWSFMVELNSWWNQSNRLICCPVQCSQGT